MFFELYDEDTAGLQATGLVEPRGPQEHVQRHTTEQMVEFAPMVQILDAPVLQTVEQLADILKLMDTQSPVEQVIDVPKIVLDLVSQRSSLRAPQLAEQLVDVPVLTCAIATAELREEIMALARDASGRTWFHVRGPCGAYWLLSGSRHVQWRGSPPAQGGKQILGAVPSLRPCPTSSGSLRRTVDGASLQFIDRAVDIAVLLQRQVRTVSNCAFLDWSLTCPPLCMSRSSTTLSWRRGRFSRSSSADP